MRSYVYNGLNPIDNDFDKFNISCNNESCEGEWQHYHSQPPHIRHIPAHEYDAMVAKQSAAREQNRYEVDIIKQDASLAREFYMLNTSREQRSYANRLFKDQQRLNKLGLSNKDYNAVLRYVTQNWRHDHEPLVLVKVDPGRQSVARFRPNERSQRHSKIERKAHEGDYQVQRFDKNFIESVKRAREAKGWSQAELATHLNRVHGDIRDFEAGHMVYDGTFKSQLSALLF